jgi:hypothetical protein
MNLLVHHHYYFEHLSRLVSAMLLKLRVAVLRTEIDERSFPNAEDFVPVGMGANSRSRAEVSLSLLSRSNS